jgi:hypothetical protein
MKQIEQDIMEQKKEVPCVSLEPIVFPYLTSKISTYLTCYRREYFKFVIF